jgi:hypothetical protein
LSCDPQNQTNAVEDAVSIARNTSNGDLIEIEYRFSAPELTKKGTEISVGMGGLPKIQQAGAPSLPVRPTQILIPYGSAVQDIQVRPGRKISVVGSYQVEAAQEPYPLSFVGPIQPTAPDPSIYQSSAVFPGRPYSETDVTVQSKRNFRILVLSLFPVQFIPTDGALFYYDRITVVVRLASAQRAVARRKISSSESSYLSKIVDNPKALTGYRGVAGKAAKAASILPLNDYKYVIITQESFADSAFVDLKEHKIARGITATIVTIEWIYENFSGLRPDGGTDNPTKIRNFIKAAFQDWGTEYVLLGGASAIVPPRFFWVQSKPGGTTTTMPSDMYYGCLDGTFDNDADGRYGEPTDGVDGGEVDLYHDVYVGRAAVESEVEIGNFVSKTLAYEGTTNLYLRHASMLGEYLGFGGASEYAKGSMEEIRLGTANHDYTTVGFENSMYADFFITHQNEVGSCSTARLPLCEADGYWSGSDLIDVINGGNCSFDGVHLLNHLGHCSYTSCMKINTSSISSLQNNLPFFAYSQGCLPGGFDTNDCLAEELTAGPHGAFAVIMNARYGWGTYSSTDGPSQRYHRPFWRAVFDEGLTRLAQANAFSKEQFNIARINDSCMRWCYYETNLFGDPELRFKIGNDVGYSESFVDDDGEGSSDGDGDGVIEPDETIEIRRSLRNLTQSEVHNVYASLSTSDAYVTVLHDSEPYGDIAPGEEASSSDFYVFRVDAACPGGSLSFSTSRSPLTREAGRTRFQSS